MKVLVVDDSRSMRRLERDVLSDLGGVEVVEAEDGISAIRTMRDMGFQFDLILTDWTMPRMDGLAFVRHVKGTPNLRRIPILMVTSCSDESKMRLAWSTGVDGYLLKPFTKEVILKAIVALKIEFASEVQALISEDSKEVGASLLEELPVDLRSRIVNMSARVQARAGDVILDQGQVPEYFCFVEHGRVTELAAPVAAREAAAPETTVREYGPGGCFGVTELMSGDPLRSKFVTATASQVGRLPKMVFEGMLEKFPKISLILSRHLAAQAHHIELAARDDQSDLAGRLEVLDLPTLVQAVNLRQKSCVIELPDINAQIVFLCGQVVAVTMPGSEGEEAFFRIMAQNPRQFRLVANPQNVQRNVQVNTMKLLLEAARHIDERSVV